VVLTDFGQSNDTSVACSSSRSESLLASDVETASLEGPESALSSALVHVAAGDASDAVRLSAGEEKDRGAKNSVVEKQLQPSKLLGNLDYTTQLNGVKERSRILRLDWHECLSPGYAAAEQFEVVIGSDVIYYSEDAPALAAAILAHTSPTGVFYLMNRRGRPGLAQVLELLKQKGQVEEHEYTLFNNFDSTPLLMVQFRHR